MSFAEIEGWLQALRTLRQPTSRFGRRPGRGRAAAHDTMETRTTRSISLRRARPAMKKEAPDGT